MSTNSLDYNLCPSSKLISDVDLVDCGKSQGVDIGFKLSRISFPPLNFFVITEVFEYW